MRLTPPKKRTWWICVILGAIGVILEIVSMAASMSVLSIIGFWVTAIALVLLILSTALKGL